ncbi:hypothetical protein O181_022148 [Austropuccinia psidii MF-1]|uniref:Uncharacterized protein n=1 Tax=Austropuccinia psidii MF-1 TaxID=1389203 RepID=A0A9Q3CEM7_9BASI|nr:hypothetical protein [Austropuccinia psidii MF-1]
MTPSPPPPIYFVLITSFPKSSLVQAALSYFSHNPQHLPIYSSFYTNGIHGPDLSNIASIFGNPVLPVVNYSNIPSPGFVSSPPYDPHIISPLPVALLRQCKEKLNQICAAFNYIFWN